MKGNRMKKYSIAVIILVMVFSSCSPKAQNHKYLSTGTNHPSQDNNIISMVTNQVSQDNIIQTIRVLQDDRSKPGLDNQGTRFFNQTNHEEEGIYIRDQFKYFGLKTEFQEFQPTDEDCINMPDKCNRFTTMKNIVATLPGIDSSKIYIIMAHYDSINGWIASNSVTPELPAPGANDNGSGIATLLEAARILSQYNFRYTIRFIAFDAEELERVGSINYVRRALNNCEPIAGFINVDMIGISDREYDHVNIYSEKNSVASNSFAELMMNLNNVHQFIKLDHVSIDIEQYSDQAPFITAGYEQGVYISPDADHLPEIDKFMHSKNDTLYNTDGSYRLSPTQMASVTRLTVATLITLAGPLSKPRDNIAMFPEQCGEIKDDLESSFHAAGNINTLLETLDGYSGHFYWMNIAEANTESRATWNITINKPGKYDLYVYIPDSPAMTHNAVYEVLHDGQISKININQSKHPNQWIKLGRFIFSGNQEELVRLSNVTGEMTGKTRVVFDAIGYHYLEPFSITKSWNNFKQWLNQTWNKTNTDPKLLQIKRWLRRVLK
jgi:hypothetical protein